MKKSCLALTFLVLPLLGAFASNLLLAVSEEVSNEGKTVVSVVRYRLVEDVLGFGFDRGDVVTDMFLGKPQGDYKTRLQREMELSGSDTVLYISLIWKAGEKNSWDLVRVDWEIFAVKGKKSGKSGSIKAPLSVPSKPKDPAIDALASDLMKIIRNEL